MSEKIVVPLDGSEPSLNALEFAVTLAKESDATLDVVAVLDLAHLDPEAGFYLTENELEKLREAMKADVLEVAKQKVPSEVTVNAVFLEGRVVERLLSYIEEEKPMMVCIGRTGKTAFRRLLEGSVSRNLAVHCPVPITIVG